MRWSTDQCRRHGKANKPGMAATPPACGIEFDVVLGEDRTVTLQRKLPQPG
jgi:hypothetical protein